MNPGVRSFQMFWVGVCENLRQKLRDNGHYQKWEVFLWPDAETPELFQFRWACLLITWRERPHYPSCWGGCFSVQIDRISIGAPARYGIERGIQCILGTNQHERDVALTESLCAQGFRRPPDPHGAWLAFHNLQDGQKPMPTFTINNPADVNALDDKLEAQVLETRIVNLIWKLFDNNRAGLEALNAAYPYVPYDGRWWTHPYAH